MNSTKYLITFVHNLKQRFVEAQPKRGDFFAYVIVFALMGVALLARLAERLSTLIDSLMAYFRLGVVLTTPNAGQDIEQCYAAGANSYVQKPVDSEGFMLAIARLSDYWLNVSILPKSSK